MNQSPKRRGHPVKSEHLVVLTTASKQVGGTHYVDKAVQPWDAMESWMSHEEFVGYLRGNALKYLARCNDKGGIQDVEKAQHYIEKLLEVLNA